MALAFKRFATIAPASEEIPSAGPGSTACACSDVGGAEGGSAASGGAGSQAEGTAYKVVSDLDSNAVAGGLISTIGDAIPAGAPGESGGVVVSASQSKFLRLLRRPCTGKRAPPGSRRPPPKPARTKD